MYKLGEVAPKTQKIALYDYKGDKVGEQDKESVFVLDV